MSLKRFNADVRVARERLQEQATQGVTAIERGDSEGEFVVTFSHQKLPKPLPIRALAHDIEEYPDGNSFMLFIDSDDVTENITTTLEKLQKFTFGQKVLRVIATLSTGIQRAFNNDDSRGYTNLDGAEEIHLSEGGAEDDETDDGESLDDFDYSDDDDDDYEEFGLGSLHLSPSAEAARMTSVVLKRIRRDLRKAHEAGCKVGIIGGLDESSTTHIMSLSLRANKLGLSQEALEAWDVEASDHIVLLIRIEGLYPCSEEVVLQSCVNFTVQFRFGKCIKYKPSHEKSLAAFATTAKEPARESTVPSVENGDQAFQDTFISTSLEQFMNESFIALLKLRFRGCATWDDANAELRSMSSISHHHDQAKDKGKEATSSKPAENSKGDCSTGEISTDEFPYLQVFCGRA